MFKNISMEALIKEVSRRQDALVEERARLLTRVEEIDGIFAGLNGAKRLAGEIEKPPKPRKRAGRTSQGRRKGPGIVRRAVIESLAEGAGQAREIGIRARKRVRGLSSASVCWSLKDLVRIGKAKRSGKAGSYRYELVSGG